MTQIKEQPIYTTIFHKTRINLDLTCNEYCVADTIFCLSNNPSSKFSGWCYASKETIGDFLGITKQCVHQIINTLIEKGLIEKEPETKYLKTTSLWYDKVVIERIKTNSKESLPMVKKVYSTQETKFTTHSKESLPNNNIDNNKDNKSISKDIGKPASYGNEDINKVVGFLKEKIGGSLDGSEKSNRQYAHLLIGRMKKDYPGHDPTDLIAKLINFALADEFHQKNLTSFKYLFYNAGKIIQGIKSRTTNPKVIKI